MKVELTIVVESDDIFRNTDNPASKFKEAVLLWIERAPKKEPGFKATAVKRIGLVYGK